MLVMMRIIMMSMMLQMVVIYEGPSSPFRVHGSLKFFRNRPMVFFEPPLPSTSRVDVIFVSVIALWLFFEKHHITIAPPLSSPWLPEGRVTTRPKGWSGRVLRVVDLRGPPTSLAQDMDFNFKADEVTPYGSSTCGPPPLPLIS